MKTSLIRILIVIVALFSNSCRVLQEIVSEEKPTLTLADFKVDQISLSKIDLLFEIEIDNPKPLSIALNSYDYSLKIANQPFVSGTQILQTSVEAASSSTVQVPVTLGYQDLLDTFQNIRENNETDFTFEGSISMDVPLLGVIEIPYSQSGKLPVVKRPILKVKSMDVRSLSLSKIALDFNFEIENPNAFNIILSNFSYDLAINKLDAISGVLSRQVQIDSKNKNSLTIPVEVNVLQAGMGIYRAFASNESIDFSFSGNTTLGTDLPYFKASTFNFSRNGSVDLPN